MKTDWRLRTWSAMDYWVELCWSDVRAVIRCQLLATCWIHDFFGAPRFMLAHDFMTFRCISWYFMVPCPCIPLHPIASHCILGQLVALLSCSTAPSKLSKARMLPRSSQRRWSRWHQGAPIVTTAQRHCPHVAKRRASNLPVPSLLGVPTLVHASFVRLSKYHVRSCKYHDKQFKQFKGSTHLTHPDSAPIKI